MKIEAFVSSFSEGTFVEVRAKPKPKQPQQTTEKDDDKGLDSASERESKLFTCPIEGCIKEFQRYSSIDHHLQYDKCQLQEERASLFDRAKTQYHDKLLRGQGTQPGLLPHVTSPTNNETLVKGWALKKTKTSARFSQKQRQYLDEMFFRGQETGQKANPSTVAQEMRYVKDFEGKRKFKVDEFLSSSQVQSYFSRKASKVKKVIPAEGHVEIEDEGKEDGDCEDDEPAADDETAYSQARSSIVNECHLQHPVLYEATNLCELFSKRKLNKLSISYLQLICQDLELDTSGITARRKAPYVELLSNVLRTCSCLP